jgi:Xaa-Pro aminopeptidase
VSTATARRQDGLDKLLADRDLAALVTCSYESLHYFAQADIQTQLHVPDRLEFFVAVRDEEPSLLVCNIEESQVRTQTPVADVQAYVEFEDDPADRLARLLRGRGIERGRVGIESRRLPSAALTTLERELTDVELVAVDASLDELQMVKTEDELASLAHCAQLLLDALDETIAKLHGGCTEQAYANELLGRIVRGGAMPIFLVFSSGARTTLGHPEPEDRPLEAGAVWRTDFGARLRGGMIGDVARTGVVGTPTAAQEEIFAGLRAAQDAIVAAIEPGRPARELYETCRRAFASARLPFLMPHVGHGVGYGLHEPPLLEPWNDTPLQAGTALYVEPFAILAERGEGYHTEDLVLVADQGPQRLTEPQGQLLRLLLPNGTTR